MLKQNNDNHPSGVPTLTTGTRFRFKVARSLRSILWKQSCSVKASFTVDRWQWDGNWDNDIMIQTAIDKSAKSQWLTILVVFVEAVGGFLASILFLQQGQEPLLLLAAAVHEVVPWLRVQVWNRAHQEQIFTLTQDSFWELRLKTDPRKLRWAREDACPTVTGVTYLHVVAIGAGLREDSRYGWITAHFQVIFGALIPLKEISKVTSWFSEKER